MRFRAVGPDFADFFGLLVIVLDFRFGGIVVNKVSVGVVAVWLRAGVFLVETNRRVE